MGREDSRLSEPTSHQSPTKPLRKSRWLSHALLEAATRGHALTSYQGHKNHRVSGSPGAGSSELKVAASNPGGAEKGAGSGEELGLWTWAWVQILTPSLKRL